MANNTRTKKTRHKVASAKPPTGLAERLLDQLVAFRPMEVTTLETAKGMVEATVCQIVSIDQEEAVHVRDAFPVFWTVVRDQLKHASPETPWIAGVFEQVGRAYRLRELTEEETKRVAAALDQLPD